MTLMFGVLMDNLVFSVNRFSNFSAGVTVTIPGWLSGPRALVTGMVVIFVILALLVENLRRSTVGLTIAAVRSSELGAQSLGISVFKTRILSLGFGAFIAGIGGGLLSLYAGAAVPANFSTTLGLVWLAVIVSLGVRSVSQALVAGAAYTIVPAVFGTYLPHSWSQVPIALFGLAAVQVAQHPEGIAKMHAAQLHGLGRSISKRRSYRAPTAVAP
jgi:branched-chain amino acid transport system permease protein